MKDTGAAADCHVPNVGLSISNAGMSITNAGMSISNAGMPIPNAGLPISGGWYSGASIALDAAAIDARLRAVVLERIVPRLAMIHREWKSDNSVAPPTYDDIEAFGRAVLADDSAAAEHLFQRLRARGLGVDDLFDRLLAPTARRFGELWAEDECDFLDVAIGINRLRVVLEQYADVPAQIGDSHRRALLVAGPSEQHLFGLDMVASFLRTSGWDVTVEIGISPEEAGRHAAANWFAVAGVTVSNADELDTAARVLTAIRRHSRNASIGLLAGGAALNGRPDLAARIGADASADDGASAALLAQKLYVAQFGAAAPAQTAIQAANASN